MINCPCGSQKEYSNCCEPYLTYTQLPSTPEALMRSRYTAYTQANVEYIKNTMRGKPLVGFREEEAILWAKGVNWLNLNVLDSSLDGSNTGYVEFIARFIDGRSIVSMHERSEFRFEEGRWYYVDGIQIPTKPVSVHAIARNASCPCGSQKKFKNCHGLPQNKSG